MTRSNTAALPAHEWSEPPQAGALLYDAVKDKVGEFRSMTQHDDRYWLRPVGGGHEWSARLESLHPAERYEELRARVQAANRQSRWGL
ncbi:hypothetical protein [Streptacidiphilus fuscans]|uniref:Uncharacterized protein n=1 Tax=Streptacidiphilus fuscans TaxID=2789292 RepID=A0A931B2Z4_9ACTN|nr:hypothetical protein [Streptacidiphilus fuscans]MBF9068332.1 hypothetical protein [Streptacidiphilus fuscans]